MVKPDRWQSEKCDKVLNEISNAINECRQPVAMVLVSKLLAVCPTLVLLLFGYCVRIKGEGKDLRCQESSGTLRGSLYRLLRKLKFGI